MKKCILCMLLAVVMVVGMLPAMASAVETETTAYWPNFRNSLYNSAITDAKTPVSADTTVVKWAVSKGTSWSDTPSGMIIADNALIFMGQKTITKADLQTGEVLTTSQMSAGAGFAIISPTYADGKVFCPLSGGKIEAFDVKTLESVWAFTDTLKGQNNTPITYYDGYVYTGYWNGETKTETLSASTPLPVNWYGVRRPWADTTGPAALWLVTRSSWVLTTARAVGQVTPICMP